MKEQLAQWLKTAKRVVVLTGAGMSTESGIPDFRSKSGWWRNIDPSTVATVEALMGNYDLFHAFYSARFEALIGCEPHAGHLVLADWEQRGMIHTVATQNVDGLHKLAGNQNVAELHGRIHDVYCQNCQQTATSEQFLAKESCAHCGGMLRPGIVLFGEMLPQKAWNHALEAIQAADLVLVIGTSLQVYPVNQLPKMTRGKLVYINKDVDGFEGAFDLVLQGSAKEILSEVNALL